MTQDEACTAAFEKFAKDRFDDSMTSHRFSDGSYGNDIVEADYSIWKEAWQACEARQKTEDVSITVSWSKNRAGGGYAVGNCGSFEYDGAMGFLREMLKSSGAPVAQQEASTRILSDETVQVCPECDIAGCHHIRARKAQQEAIVDEDTLARSIVSYCRNDCADAIDMAREAVIKLRPYLRTTPDSKPVESDTFKADTPCREDWGLTGKPANSPASQCTTSAATPAEAKLDVRGEE